MTQRALEIHLRKTDDTRNVRNICLQAFFEVQQCKGIALQHTGRRGAPRMRGEVLAAERGRSYRSRALQENRAS